MADAEPSTALGVFRKDRALLSVLSRWASANKAHAATFAGWFQQVCTIGGAILTIPFVLGSLGKIDAGIWFSLQGLIAIFSLSDFGFSMAISRQVAHSFKSRDGIESARSDLIDIGSGWEGIRVIYAASRAIFIRVTAVSIALFVVSYEVVIPWTNLLPQRNLQTTLVWYLLAGSFALVFQARLSQSFLDGLGYMYVGRIVAGVYQLTCGVLTVVAMRMHLGLIGLATVLLAGSALQYIVMHRSLDQVCAGNLSEIPNASPALIKRLWKVSMPFGLVNTGVYLVGAMQVPLLGALIGPAVVAPIYIAIRISQALNSTVLQVITAQLPFFTQQCAQGHWSRARTRMRETLIFGSAIQIVIAMLIYFVSPTAVNTWVGNGNYISGAVLLAFSANYLVSSVAVIPAQFVLASGRNPFAVSTLIHGALTLGGMTILCPQIGLLGAPLSGLVAILLTNFWQSPLEGWKTWRRLSKLIDAHP